MTKLRVDVEIRSQHRHVV